MGTVIQVDNRPGCYRPTGREVDDGCQCTFSLLDAFEKDKLCNINLILNILPLYFRDSSS